MAGGMGAADPSVEIETETADDMVGLNCANFKRQHSAKLRKQVCDFQLGDDNHGRDHAGTNGGVMKQRTQLHAC